MAILIPEPSSCVLAIMRAHRAWALRFAPHLLLEHYEKEEADGDRR